MIRLDTTSEQSILNMLREHNSLNSQQIKQIESLSKESGKSQIETAFELNITNDTKVAELLSESFSIPLIKLDDVKVDNNLKKFTEIRFLKENLIIPFEVDTKTIKVAIADASKFGLIKNIESLTKLQPELFAASIKQISDFIARLEQGAPAKPKNQKIEQVKKKKANVPLEVESEVIAFVDKILNEAIRLETSDIHIEPFKDSAHVRFRIDGVLRVMEQFNDFLNKDPLNYNSVVTRIKILSKLDIAERRIPQDGGSTFKYGDKEMDLRISIMPTKNNERIVMRLLNKEAGDKSLDKLGFADQDLKVLNEAIHSPQGMVLVTGPTGSGKTSLLNALANRMPVVKGGNLQGQLLVNGSSICEAHGASRFARLSSYVMQDDALNPFLTIRETLGLAASFQLPAATTLKERGAIVAAGAGAATTTAVRLAPTWI